jgi:hypothetical protein
MRKELLTVAMAAATVLPVSPGRLYPLTSEWRFQHPQSAGVMGFDQDKTAHHFHLYEDGGAIDVTVKDTRDTKNRDAIRAHLPHIAMMFGSGDFGAPMLVHDTTNVPGTPVMTLRKDKIKYVDSETPGGGRVDITTADHQAVAAIHDFLKFPIHDHKTGDSETVRKR